jgi:hypothetical protein
MSKKTVTLTVVLLVLIASLPALVACQPTHSAAATVFDYDRANIAMAHRWEAMGQAYALKVVPVSVDAATARWQTMGQAYEQLARLGARSEAVEVSAARWQAMGQAYEALSRPVSDVSSARWQAMGQAYEALSRPAGDVSSARWEAMGQAYEEAGLLGN